MSLKKKMAEAVTRDVASPNWLKWRLFLFVLCLRVNPFETAGARSEIVRETLLSNSFLECKDI